MAKILNCCACSSNDKLAKSWQRKQEKKKKAKVNNESKKR